MEKLKKVLESGKVIYDLKRELIRWSYLIDSGVISYESLDKSNTFYITLNKECDIWIWTKDITLQVRTAEAMKTILDYSEKKSLTEIIEEIEEAEGEECREYREIAEFTDDDLAPYGEA